LALRNFGDKSAVFREALRVLSDLGWFLSVDFVRPDNSLIRRIFMFHIFWVLPALGRLVSGYWYQTLTYLANSIRASTPGSQICVMLREGGFEQTFLEKITLGIVALLGGQKIVSANVRKKKKE
jgi:demethylmenaquinone methyltransferase/2-methoxy-6-polyprenyl-1,4-benzoquinol methylase